MAKRKKDILRIDFPEPINPEEIRELFKYISKEMGCFVHLQSSITRHELFVPNQEQGLEKVIERTRQVLGVIQRSENQRALFLLCDKNTDKKITYDGMVLFTPTQRDTENYQGYAEITRDLSSVIIGYFTSKSSIAPL